MIRAVFGTEEASYKESIPLVIRSNEMKSLCEVMHRSVAVEIFHSAHALQIDPLIIQYHMPGGAGTDHRNIKANESSFRKIDLAVGETQTGPVGTEFQLDYRSAFVSLIDFDEILSVFVSQPVHVGLVSENSFLSLQTLVIVFFCPDANVTVLYQQNGNSIVQALWTQVADHKSDVDQHSVAAEVHIPGLHIALFIRGLKDHVPGPHPHQWSRLQILHRK